MNNSIVQKDDFVNWYIKVDGEERLARRFFGNGYGVFIIQGKYAYTDNDQEFEIAVLKGNEDDWELTYDTYIADDVIGHLSAREVLEIMVKIKNLPSTKALPPAL